MRRVASELGLGTMSLYHYVRSKDELLDLMGDRIMGGQLVDEADLQTRLARGADRDRAGHASQLRAPSVDGRRHEPAADARSRGPTRCATSTSRSPRWPTSGSTSRARWRSSRVVDDYVIGFVVRSQRVAEHEEGLAAETIAEWMDKAFGHLRRQIESGAFPHLQRALEANRAAGGQDEDLGRMASSEGRFERGLELLLDGIEAKFATPVKQRRGR